MLQIPNKFSLIGMSWNNSLSEIFLKPALKYHLKIIGKELMVYLYNLFIGSSKIIILIEDIFEENNEIILNFDIL